MRKIRKIQYVLVGSALAVASACNNPSAETKPSSNGADTVAGQKPFQQQIAIHTHSAYDSLRNAEAREDSAEMAEALLANASIDNVVTALYETPPVRSELGEDAADDPAIWVNRNEPEKSLVIGTNKRAGLHVYDLKGNELQFVESGKVNNVDLRDGFVFGGKEQVLVAGSNRTDQCIDVYLLDKENATLSDAVLKISTGVDDVYGITMHYNANDQKYYVFVNGKDGNVEQYHVFVNEASMEHQFITRFTVESQPEGMVVDDQNGILYIGVEEKAVYKAAVVYASDAEYKLVQLKGSSRAENDFIHYDIEGLALYQTSEQSYLVASSQGNFSYAVWSLSNSIDQEDSYLKSFVIWELPGSGIDGVEETDGLEIVSTSLGQDFPKGLLVVQDGFNYSHGKEANQNFKYISWAEIEAFLK